MALTVNPLDQTFYLLIKRFVLINTQKGFQQKLNMSKQ